MSNCSDVFHRFVCRISRVLWTWKRSRPVSREKPFECSEFFCGIISTTTVPASHRLPGMKFVSVGEVVVSSLQKTFWSDSTVRSHLFLVRNKSTPSWFLISHHVSHYQFEKLCKKGIVLQRKHPTCDHEVMDCIELRRPPKVGRRIWSKK